MNIKYSTDNNKKSIFIRFDNEDDEQHFIKLLVNCIDEKYYAHVYINDIDVDIPLYEQYFNCEYLILHENTPSPVIVASNLDSETLSNVVENWGFYTFDACLAWTKESKLNKSELLEIVKKSSLDKLELVIHQVLDCSLNIIMNDYFFEICKNIIVECLKEA